MESYDSANASSSSAVPSNTPIIERNKRSSNFAPSSQEKSAKRYFVDTDGDPLDSNIVQETSFTSHQIVVEVNPA